MYSRRVLGIGTNLRYNLHPLRWEGALRHSLFTTMPYTQFLHITVVECFYQYSGYLTVHGILQHVNLLQCLALCQCSGLPAATLTLREEEWEYVKLLVAMAVVRWSSHCRTCLASSPGLPSKIILSKQLNIWGCFLLPSQLSIGRVWGQDYRACLCGWLQCMAVAINGEFQLELIVPLHSNVQNMHAMNNNKIKYYFIYNLAIKL